MHSVAIFLLCFNLKLWLGSENQILPRFHYISFIHSNLNLLSFQTFAVFEDSNLKFTIFSCFQGCHCYRTELFYFNYLSLLGLEHIYISYFLQQPKKSVCLQLLRTLLCFVFRSFRKSFFHVFARLLITL